MPVYRFDIMHLEIPNNMSCVYLCMNSCDYLFITGYNSSTVAGAAGIRPTPNISEITRNIIHYNEMQLVYNEDIHGPMQNDTVIIVIQVHNYRCS